MYSVHDDECLIDIFLLLIDIFLLFDRKMSNTNEYLINTPIVRKNSIVRKIRKSTKLKYGQNRAQK